MSIDNNDFLKSFLEKENIDYTDYVKYRASVKEQAAIIEKLEQLQDDEERAAFAKELSQNIKQAQLDKVQAPSVLAIPILKAADAVFHSELSELSVVDGVDVHVGISDRSPKVHLQLYFSLDQNMLPQNLTAYDQVVFTGICSLLESGQHVFTSEHVYEAFSGSKTKNSQSLSAVTKSIKKMQTTLLQIDWTEHARSQGYDLTEEWDVMTESPVLTAETVIIKNRNNGKEVHGYSIQNENIPSLLRYSKAVGQLISVPSKLLEIDSLSNTESIILLKNYLIRSIETMKYYRRSVRQIDLRDIEANCDIDLTKGHRQTRARNLEKIRIILDYYVEQRYIKSYSIENLFIDIAFHNKH